MEQLIFNIQRLREVASCKHCFQTQLVVNNVGRSKLGRLRNIFFYYFLIFLIVLPQGVLSDKIRLIQFFYVKIIPNGHHMQI